MFQKALKIIAPSVVKTIVCLTIAAFAVEVQAIIYSIIIALLGICGGFIGALYFAATKNNDKNK